MLFMNQGLGKSPLFLINYILHKYFLGNQTAKKWKTLLIKKEKLKKKLMKLGKFLIDLPSIILHEKENIFIKTKEIKYYFLKGK